jgi:single-stranded DNA-binding protein
MNTVILLGNLVRDPELKQLGNGNAVVNFVIAVNEKPYKERKFYLSRRYASST